MFKNHQIKRNHYLKVTAAAMYDVSQGPPSFYRLPRGAGSSREASNTWLSRAEGQAWGCSCPEQCNPMKI